MVRVAAVANVASVTNKEALSDWAEGKSKCDTMRQCCFLWAVYCRLTVSVATYAQFPRPAIIRPPFINLVPKVTLLIFSELDFNAARQYLSRDFIHRFDMFGV